MNHEYTEILFVLYIQNRQVTMDWLIDFFSYRTDGEQKGETDIRRYVGKLVSLKMVDLYLEEGCIYVGLTELGECISVAAADILSQRTDLRWQFNSISTAKE